MSRPPGPLSVPLAVQLRSAAALMRAATVPLVGVHQMVAPSLALRRLRLLLRVVVVVVFAGDDPQQRAFAGAV